MDIQRSAKEEAEWRASGARGKRPERLMEERELPNVYKKEYDTIVQHEDDTAEYGRGQRPRGEVHYDDGLTEDQWVNAIQDDDIDVNEIIAKKQAAKKRRLAKKSQKLHQHQELSQKPTHQDPIQHVSHYEELSVDTSEAKKKRGRPRKDDVHVTDDTAEPSQQSKSKKKGKNKRIEIVDYGGPSEPKSKKRKANKKAHDDDSVLEGSSQQEQMKRAFMQCYSTVETLTDDSEGEPRQRAYLFLVLPSKKDYPFYYQIITKPIAMDTIKKRIKNNYYKTVKQFRDDWHLMFDNARTFNEEGSLVYIDADKMQEAFDNKLGELCPGGEFPTPEGMDI